MASTFADDLQYLCATTASVTLQRDERDAAASLLRSFHDTCLTRSVSAQTGVVYVRVAALPLAAPQEEDLAAFALLDGRGNVSAPLLAAVQALLARDAPSVCSAESNGSSITLCVCFYFVCQYAH
jgi:hypothetical protein